MNPIKKFHEEVQTNISNISRDKDIQALSRCWVRTVAPYKYAYNFSWLDRPIIQIPQDIIAMQELIWQVKPDLIIETGIAHGGSLILSASLLVMLEYCDAVEHGQKLDPQKPVRKVLGVDIDIRSHNLDAIEAHPMSSRIEMIQGSSIAPDTIALVKSRAKDANRILVCLDSNHTHDHVMAELEAYAPLTSAGSYCVVFDTLIEDMPENMFPDRPWRPGNSPKTAVWEYLKSLEKNNKRAFDGGALKFNIDKIIENKLLITAAPDGFLKRVY